VLYGFHLAFNLITAGQQEQVPTWYKSRQAIQRELRGFDAKENYYWIYYEDGDSEQLDCAEMDQAVQEYGHEVNAVICQLHLDTG
jgi:hypothetical protein